MELALVVVPSLAGLALIAADVVLGERRRRRALRPYLEEDGAALGPTPSRAAWRTWPGPHARRAIRGSTRPS